MAFDADAFIKALSPPQITLNGKTYVGRFLSLEEWLPFEQRLQRIVENKADVEEVTQTVKDYFEVVFPASPFSLLNPFRKTVGEMVVALPPAGVMKAATYCFERQAHASGMERAVEIINTAKSAAVADKVS